MTDNMNREPMVEMFIFETFQLLDELEQSLINSEKESGFESSINEIFRIMHTIKGSSAMMLFENICGLAHSIEALFFYLRESKPKNYDSSEITDIVLCGVDFIKNETSKLENGMELDGDSSELIYRIREYLQSLKRLNGEEVAQEDAKEPDSGEQNPSKKYAISLCDETASSKSYKYEAVLKFEEDCEMENIRAFSVVHDLKEVADILYCHPKEVLEGEGDCEIIRKEGFKVVFATDLGLNEVKDRLSHALLLKSLDVYVLSDDFSTESVKDYLKDKDESEKGNASEQDQKEASSNDGADNQKINDSNKKNKNENEEKHGSVPSNANSLGKQSVISVNISKLDKLMDIVGELVIAEAMVTQSPDLAGLQLDNFQKSARHLNKITNELQDIVMSIRMVPLSTTFQKMNRIVRDMGKKLNKSVELEIIGEETEVDKNIIERISDPLIHLIRNSIDHGIEEASERERKGKPPVGKLVLEAKNAGGDVWIIVKDDGRGLDKEKILKKARENNLIHKPESELTDKEIYSFIFMPGFSTSDKVTEYSGRGVGMDIVTKNISMVGGSINVESVPDKGTTFSIKFPLTLAIINGMAVKTGRSSFTIPTISIKKSFRVKDEAIIEDNNGNEMIMVRGEAYPILRLHKFYNLDTDITDLNEGIIVMVENDSKVICLFADQLLGEQQVVVKALPRYIKKVRGIGGCTLLGDGSISLILDIATLINIKEV
ncbi:MAG TPA: chemotaxis protein CheA [Acetivibrio sp.]|nr:chemotaxis protein CheA [Acetivibrio sp.]